MDMKIIFPFFFLSVSLDGKDWKKEGIQKKKKKKCPWILKKKKGNVYFVHWRLILKKGKKIKNKSRVGPYLMPHKANSIICCHLPHFKEDNVKSWEQCGPLMFLSTSLSHIKWRRDTCYGSFVVCTF